MITMKKIIYCLGFALSILTTGCNDFWIKNRWRLLLLKIIC